PRRDDRRL
ncbi:hypothetical protein BN1708_020677, partial [Verticillium longisporum]